MTKSVITSGLFLWLLFSLVTAILLLKEVKRAESLWTGLLRKGTPTIYVNYSTTKKHWASVMLCSNTSNSITLLTRKHSRYTTHNSMAWGRLFTIKDKPLSRRFFPYLPSATGLSATQKNQSI